MRTSAAVRGRGLGAAILRRMLAQAEARGMITVHLETGAADYFAPARALYAKAGFIECGPFGDYERTPHNIWMVKQLG